MRYIFVFRVPKMAGSKMKLLLCLAMMLLDQASSCMFSFGTNFKEFGSMRLNAISFQALTVMNELECILTCQSQKKCLSLNVLTGNDKLACELLAADSRSFPMTTSNNFTYFEKETSSTSANSLPECQCTQDAGCRCLPDFVPIQCKHNGLVSMKAKSSGYAEITAEVPSGTYRLILVHHSGFINCHPHSWMRTKFGCSISEGGKPINIVVSDTKKEYLLPGSKGFLFDGDGSDSNLVMFNEVIEIQHGQKLWIWNKEDFNDFGEVDNNGTVEFYVLVLRT